MNYFIESFWLSKNNESSMRFVSIPNCADTFLLFMNNEEKEYSRVQVSHHNGGAFLSFIEPSHQINADHGSKKIRIISDNEIIFDDIIFNRTANLKESYNL